MATVGARQHTVVVHDSRTIHEDIDRAPVLYHLADGGIDVTLGRDVALQPEFAGIFRRLWWRDIERRDLGSLLKE